MHNHFLYVCLNIYFCLYISCFGCLGCAIIQLPELIISSLDILKKTMTRENILRQNKLDDHSSKHSDCNPDSTFMTITRTAENNADIQFVKMMEIIDYKIDQKISLATQKILDLVSHRFDNIRS